MHATKGGWLGQTFALAKHNESSGGKKTRTRRSKEERKGMVESFIKRYQKLNNGSFPSLNLTYKEVGGSYYTVREIVREIIQENRVLAQPKLAPGEENMENLDGFLEHYPLGSISVDPHIHVVPPKDAQTLVDEYEVRSEKVLDSKMVTELQQEVVDKDIVVNGTVVRNEELEDPIDVELLVKRDEKGLNDGEEIIDDAKTSRVLGSDVAETTHAAVANEKFEQEMQTELFFKRGNEAEENEGTELESKISLMSEPVVIDTNHATVSNAEPEEPKHTELLMEKGLEGQKDEVKEVEAHQTQTSHLSDVVVETFPLRPVARSYIMEEKPIETEVLNGDLEEKGIASGELAAGNDKKFVHSGKHLLENSIEEVDTQLEGEPAVLSLESGRTLLNQKTQNRWSTKESLVVDVNGNTDVKVDDTLPAEFKAVSGAKNISGQNLDSNNSGSSLQQSTLNNMDANNNKANIEPSGNSEKKRSDATLDRINLESWEAASKKSDHQEMNPLLIVIRVFINAFVRFWTE